MPRKQSPGDTPASKRLRQLRVEHEVVEYSPELESGIAVATYLGEDPSRILKTLVVQDDPPRGKPWLALVPSDAELDLKRFAAAAGLKRARMARRQDAEAATGMKAGAISPIPLAARGFPMLIDARAQEFPSVLVSAGVHGFEIRIAGEELAEVLGAAFATISRPSGEGSAE